MASCKGLSEGEKAPLTEQPTSNGIKDWRRTTQQLGEYCHLFFLPLKSNYHTNICIVLKYLLVLAGVETNAPSFK